MGTRLIGSKAYAYGSVPAKTSAQSAEAGRQGRNRGIEFGMATRRDVVARNEIDMESESALERPRSCASFLAKFEPIAVTGRSALVSRRGIETNCRVLAIVGISLALALGGSAVPATGKESPAELFNRGVELLNKGDLDGAIAAYRAAILADPKDANAHYALGVALRRKGDVDGAIAEYRAAIQLNPGHVDAHSNLGMALSEEGDVDAAIEEYKAAIRLNPDQPADHINLGIEFQGRSDLDGAIAQYRADRDQSRS